MTQDKIMIVDDEKDIIDMIRMHLTRQGYDIIWTDDSSEAVELMENEHPQLVLLDIMMQGIDGYELCSRIREVSSVPVIFMSCKTKDMDKVMGFSIGGDDYITKPFSLAELTARVQAHLRRSHMNAAAYGSDSSDAPGSLSGAVPFGTGEASSAPVSISTGGPVSSFGDIHIDTVSHSAFFGPVELDLTAKEYDLLCLLVKYPNRVFTPRQIFDALWDSYGLENDVRTVAVHISNLRRKLEKAGAPKGCIRTVRGVGYKLTDAARL